MEMHWQVVDDDGNCGDGAWHGRREREEDEMEMRMNEAGEVGLFS